MDSEGERIIKVTKGIFVEMLSDLGICLTEVLYNHKIRGNVI